MFNPTLEEHGWQSTHTIIEIVNDDMPFLVDSVTMEVNRHGLTLHLIIHPLLLVDRDAEGTLLGLGTEGAPVRAARIVHPRRSRPHHRSQAPGNARGRRDPGCLGDVRLAVTDWKAMQDKVLAVVAELEEHPPPIPPEQFEEGCAFLRWLAANHLTLLGYRRHELVTVDGQDALKIVPGSSLGLLRDGETKDVSSSFAALPPEVRAYARRPELLVITKSTTRSTVHRPGYLDYIAVKRFDAAGNVIGEDRFLGLYTSTAYSANPADIPLLRRKTANVVARAGVPPGGHAGKALLNILANYPRDELFQITEDELLQTAMAILHLGERQRFRLFVRRDPFERFLSCLIYAPRENYHDRAAPEVAGDPHRGVQRQQLRIQRAPVRVGAGAHPDHRAHDAGQDSRVRRARTGSAARRLRPALGRRPEGRAGRGSWARRAATSCCASSAMRSRPATVRKSPRVPRCRTSR